MQINSLGGYEPYRASPAPAESQARELESAAPAASRELREKFDTFVGETFFSQMLTSLRKTVDKPAYFHGGRAEEVFQGQFDQMLSQELTKASAGQFSGPMFELFMLGRS
jgi:flagellar protein FlgJ